VKTTKQTKLSSRFGQALAAIGIIALISMISISAANLENNDGNDAMEATLGGTVFHAKTGQPLPGTLIILSFHDIVKTTEADNNGNFMFKNIPICFCLKNLSAQRDGFEEWSEMIAVNGTTFENIFLEPKNAGNAQKAIELSTDNSSYELGENVTIYMTNTGSVTLEHVNGYGGGTITDAEGKLVFNGWAVDTGNSSLHPNQMVTVGIWDQRDNDNVQVQSGTYVIEKVYGGASDSIEVVIRNNVSHKAIYITTDKHNYFLGQNVTIFMTNSGTVTLEHNSGYGAFNVLDSDGNIVFSQDCVTDALSMLAPGETVMVGVWNQQDNQENQVSPDTYIIEKEYGGVKDSTEFTITREDDSGIEVFTDQAAYGIGDCVTIYVMNIGDKTLFHLNGWGGYTIVNSDGEVVFEVEVLIEMVTSLQPKETVMIGTWEQLDDAGNPVHPDTYTIIKEYGGSTDTTDFEIRNYFIPIKGDIVGVVADAETNNPLPNTTVTLEYHGFLYTTLTNSDGWYEFKDVSMCNCTKDITASKDGYEDWYFTTSVSEITFVNISMEPIEDPHDPDDDLFGIITGIVTDSDSDVPLRNALITLEYHEELRTTFTDYNGNYIFTQVPICFCLKELTVVKDGFKTNTKLESVSKSTIVDFSMEKDPSGNEKVIDNIQNISQSGSGAADNGKLSFDIYFPVIAVISLIVVLVILGARYYKLKNQEYY
jgi:hypothetical protein